MKGFFKEMKRMLSSDKSDKISSKRLITFLAFIIVSTAFALNLFLNYTVDANMFDGMIQIVWAGLGVVVGEHLFNNKNGEPEPEHEEGYAEGYNDTCNREEELGDN